MHLNLHFQARPRIVDAPCRFVHSFRSEDIYHSSYQNGWPWVDKSVTIAQLAFPQNRKQLHPTPSKVVNDWSTQRFCGRLSRYR